MNDFERLCAYGVAARLKVLDVHAKEHWDFLEESEKAEERRGMLAVLREMREPGPVIPTEAWDGAESWWLTDEEDLVAAWQRLLDALIAQAEASESEAVE